MKGKTKCRASGGGVKTDLVSGNPNVIAEARERKKGGKVMPKMFGKPEGEKSKHRADRPQRKRGGAVNATKNPFSSARSTTSG